MTDDAARRDDWDRLRAERAAARADLVRALGAIESRAKDPFGLKEKFRRNPALFAGLAAGAGAILVNLLVPGGSRRRDDDTPSGSGAGATRPADASSPVFDAIRDAALKVATPWITRFVAEHLGEVVEPGGTDTPPE